MIMKFKTSTRISITFSIFIFFITFFILILLNIFYFFGWYNGEKREIWWKIDTEYGEVLNESINSIIQKSELIEDIGELWWFLSDSGNLKNYKNLFYDLYYKDNLYYIFHEKNTNFWKIIIPYNITTYVLVQIRLIKIWLSLLFIFSILSFFISKFLFIKLALKKIYYISDELKKIDLNNIKKINLDTVKGDEVGMIILSINNFLEIIEKNTKSLKQFNTQVAHEFKTPLMVISSELEYINLSWNKKWNEKIAKNESYKKIENQIEILNNLLETFLFISKIENFKWEIKKDNVNISKIIEEKVGNLNTIYKEKEIKIIKNNFKKIILKTDEKLFTILIQNLLDNAFKYNKNKWTVEIILNEEYLIIKDDWIGIKKSEINKIFDSFYRVNNNQKWYWIWLNIVQKIANILNYKISVESEEKVWSEFKIIFR